MNAWGVVNGESNLDGFLMGFRLGASTISRLAEGGLIMEKYIYEEKNGLWYEHNGDYYMPRLKLPDEEQVEIEI